MIEWLFDEFDELIYISDIHTYDLLYLNKMGQRILGLKEGRPKPGMKCYAYLQGKKEPCEFCTNHLITEDKFYRWEIHNRVLGAHYILKDRKIIWEGREARIEFAQDITEIKQQLERSKGELSSVIESIPGGVCQIDGRDFETILWHNDTFLDIVGYTKEQYENEMYGMASYIHPDDKLKSQALMFESKRTGNNAMADIRVIKRDGTVRTLMVTCRYTKDQLPYPVIYSVGIDITEYREENERSKRAIEDALKVAEEANIAKGSFLSRMSHEIRTPLNAVIGMSTIAMNSLDDKDRLQDCHKKIESAAKYLLSLINDILDISKIDSGKMHLAMHKFSIADFAHDVIALFIGQMSRNGISFEPSATYFESEYFIGDSLRLKQVIINLLSNAMKFTNSGGKVTLSIKKLSEDSNFALLEFAVGDTGIGMKPEFKKRAFETFEQADGNITTRYGGSGLGLSISKHITVLMGGMIDFTSSEGKGTEFKVTVPLEKCKEKHCCQPNKLNSEGLGVLLVDDQSTYESARAILKHSKVRLKWEPSAVNALKKLAMAPSTYDVIIAANTLTGITLVEFLHGIQDSPCKNAKVIVSAYNVADISENTGKGLVDGFIQKPFFARILCDTINNVLEKAQDVRTCGDTDDSFKNKCVLLVEDNKVNLEIAYTLLTMRGMVVDKAENGLEAVTAFNDAPAGHYDLILMDIRMPEMDGLTATKIIRNSRKQDAQTIPIVALSANAFDEEKEDARRCGMNDHISKPIDTKIMFDTIARFI